jgi:hypothetical protein
MTVGLLGASLILGGLMQLLTPMPEYDVGVAQEGSKYIPATSNTTKIGTRIPILYGTRMVGGHILSVNIDASNSEGYEDLNTQTVSAVSSGSEIVPNIFQKGSDGEVDDPNVTVFSGSGTAGDATLTLHDAIRIMNKDDYQILPIFTSSVASPTNTPTEGFLS